MVAKKGQGQGHIKKEVHFEKASPMKLPVVLGHGVFLDEKTDDPSEVEKEERLQSEETVTVKHLESADAAATVSKKYVESESDVVDGSIKLEETDSSEEKSAMKHIEESGKTEQLETKPRGLKITDVKTLSDAPEDDVTFLQETILIRDQPGVSILKLQKRKIKWQE